MLLIVACNAAAQDIVIGAKKPTTAAVAVQPDLVLGQAKTPPRALAQQATEPKASPQRAWTVELKDVHLANTFQRWAAEAGWRIRWDAAKHVMVEAPDTFTGSFEDAIASQLASPGIAYSGYPLEVCFYPNTPPLARVTRKGEQLKECQ
ncbi:TcpQ domain-containing protein [Variovorax sp. KK3]|uniref:TcpQ domain-containing protein n=1 Tax=Variovorax sp. KK3 TaxID=1855728 RepID=UPI0021197E1D|nr:TcpQ domain-containing protein [Variovorax sp. KK3]